MGKQLELLLMNSLTQERTVFGCRLKFNHITDAKQVGIDCYYGIKTYIRERQHYFKGKLRQDFSVDIKSKFTYLLSNFYH